MNTDPGTPPEAWRLHVLKHLQANPSLSQRQLAAQLGVSLGKANYCLRALVEKGLVKLGNFRKNQNKRQYAYLLTPAEVEEKTRIAQAFLKRKEAEFEAIRREIEALKGELESCEAECQPGDRVRVSEGPLKGYEGILLSKSGQARVMLLLEMLGKEVRTHLPSSQIESTDN